MAGTYWIAIGLCEDARPTSSIFFVGVWFLSIYNLLLVPAAAAPPLFGWPLRRNRKTATDREVRGVEIRRRSSIRLYGVRLNRKISSQSHSPQLFLNRQPFSSREEDVLPQPFLLCFGYTYPRYVIVSEPRILLNKKPRKDRRTFRVAARAGNAHEP